MHANVSTTNAMPIDSPTSPRLDELGRWLSDRAGQLVTASDWPAEQLAHCARRGVFRWFLPVRYGGWEWTEAQIARGYLTLAASCLTTTFVITQLVGASRRIAASPALADPLGPDLASGATLATVGISHLTTSRHARGPRPALVADSDGDGWKLTGVTPWVTGAAHADWLVVGATQPDGRQLVVAVPRESAGVAVSDPFELVALSASQTARVTFDGVRVEREWLIDGPRVDVMKSPAGAATGGLATSALALGVARAAAEFVEREAAGRAELVPIAAALRAQYEASADELVAAAEGRSTTTTDELRRAANDLVLRTTQAALTAAKGSGFVLGHPVARWCREALFFLVWSCPPAVAATHLCDLAGVDL